MSNDRAIPETAIWTEGRPGHVDVDVITEERNQKRSKLVDVLPLYSTSTARAKVATTAVMTRLSHTIGRFGTCADWISSAVASNVSQMAVHGATSGQTACGWINH